MICKVTQSWDQKRGVLTSLEMQAVTMALVSHLARLARPERIGWFYPHTMPIPTPYTYLCYVHIPILLVIRLLPSSYVARTIC